jgi:hypothetical protein
MKISVYNFDEKGQIVLDSSENKAGFYKIDKYKNETWGLGSKWKMFRFVDTLRDIKY